MKTQNTPHWHLALALAAWTAFGVCFFLPSYGDNLGYQCAAMQGFFWGGAMQGNWTSIHYLLLTLPNLLMLTSPFLMLRFGGYARGLSWLRYSAFASSILVWSFLILLLVSNDGKDLRVGAYVWASSFVVLWASSVLPHKGLFESGGLKHGALCV
jgi:hypothetical protein